MYTVLGDAPVPGVRVDVARRVYVTLEFTLQWDWPTVLTYRMTRLCRSPDINFSATEHPPPPGPILP